MFLTFPNIDSMNILAKMSGVGQWQNLCKLGGTGQSCTCISHPTSHRCWIVGGQGYLGTPPKPLAVVPSGSPGDWDIDDYC